MSELFSIRGVLFLLLALWFGTKALRRPVYGAAFMTAIILLRDPYLRVVFPAIYEQLHTPLLFGLLSMASIFLFNREAVERFGFPATVKFLFAYIAVIYYSSFLNGFGQDTPAEAFKSALLFVIVLFSIRDRDDLLFMVKSVVAIVFFLFLNVYYDYKVLHVDLSASRYKFMNRNALGGMFACLLPLGITMLWYARSRLWQLAVWGICGAMALGTILTYSRSALLAMVTGVAAMILWHKELRKALVITTMIASVAVGIKVSDKFWDRMDTITEYKEDASAMGRVAMNRAAMQMLKENLFFGIGAGNFRDLSYAYTPSEDRQWVAEGKQIHNIVMQVLSENGLVGGAFFVGMIWVVMRKGYRVIKLGRSGDPELLNLHQGLFAATFCYLVAAQFGQGAYFGLLYFLLPLLAASSHLNLDAVRAAPAEQPAKDSAQCAEGSARAQRGSRPSRLTAGWPEGS